MYKDETFEFTKWNWKIHNIEKQFLNCYSVKLFDWQGLFEDFEEEQNCLELQICLADSTIKHPLNKTYPVRISYQQAFIKHLINNLEHRKLEVCDDIYESYTKLLQSKDSNTHFRHFYLTSAAIPCNTGTYITLEESVNLISDGTTGLHCWQAAIALADYCLQNQGIVAGKVVLELGSGIGLTGLSVIASNIVSKYFFSDCHPSVLKLLCSNVKLNVDKWKRNSSLSNEENNLTFCDNVVLDTKVYKTNVSVLNLPWEDVNEEVIHELNPDVILAADVVFDNSLFESLINALKHCLHHVNVSAILACTVRNVDTLNSFIELLVSRNFLVVELDLKKTLLNDVSMEIKLFKVSLVSDK